MVGRILVIQFNDLMTFWKQLNEVFQMVKYAQFSNLERAIFGKRLRPKKVLKGLSQKCYVIGPTELIIIIAAQRCGLFNATCIIMYVHVYTCTVHTVYLYPHNAHLSLSTKSSGCGPVMSCSSEAPFACAGSRSVLTGSFHCGFHRVASFLWPSVETRYWLGNFFHCITSGITSCTHSSDNQRRYDRRGAAQAISYWLLSAKTYDVGG